MASEDKKRKKRKFHVNTPTVLQMEAVECGAASLAMILGYYKRYEPLEELRYQCGVSRDGSKASNILKAARTYGLESNGYKKGIDDLLEMDLPCILFWNFNHFVVLEGHDNKFFYLNDPAEGKRKVTHKDFGASYTGIVLTFRPGSEFKPGGHRPNVLQSLFERVKYDKHPLIFIILSGLLLILPGIIVPIFSKIFVDNILVDRLNYWLHPLLIFMIITAIVQGTLTWIQSHYLLRLQTKLSVRESSRFLWHILHLPISFFSQRYAGDIASRVAINERLSSLITGRLAVATIQCVMVLFYLVIMVLFDWVLSLVALSVAVLNIMAIQIAGNKIKDANRYLLNEQGKLFGVSMNGIQMIETLKATGTESDFFARWAGYQTKVTNAGQKVGKQLQLLGLVPVFLSSLLTAVVLSLGAYRVIQGDMTMGMLVAYQALVIGFIHPFQELANLGSEIKKVEGDVNRLDDVFHYPADYTNGQLPLLSGEKPTKLLGYVNIDGISFGYNRLEEPLIKDFNLFLEPGARVAIVGGSSAGKTTMAKLVMGLYEPWEGEIRFDNELRSEIPGHVLHHSIALVDQDIMLLEGTIRDNITLWNSQIPEQDIIQAAKDACIHDVIASRKDGYNSLVTEGGFNFSGGQRQRLEIARALVRNPRILVLDEATSALDPAVEQIINENLRRRGCTCIIAAHRLSTIRDSDEIIVLDKGRVVQRGSHEELINDEGLYRKLVKED